MIEIIDFLKKYTDGKQNTEKVEISVLQLNRVIKALEQEPKFIAKSDGTIEQIKNCNNCKYGYLSSICQKPSTEICGNSFSQWKLYKAESEETDADSN